MWQVINQTPYAAEGAWIRNHLGEEIWTVIIKGTWDILPDGTTTLSTIQIPVNSGPVFQNDGKRLLYDTDAGPAKLATDIVLNGHAYAKNGRSTSILNVGLKVGNVFRLARVYGDRIWDGKQYSQPTAFIKMPLSYKNMSQGAYYPFAESYYNPEGIPVSQKPEAGISMLPHVEFYDDEVPGFGAIPRHWPGRLQFSGTYDENWQYSRAPLLPEDLDARYWQCSPAPLYAGGQLKGGEVVCLGNMTPPGAGHNGLLVFALPRVFPVYRTQFYDGSLHDHQATLHTVILEPDFPRVSMVWHSALACHHLVNQLESTTVSEKRSLFVKPRMLPGQFPEWENLS